MGTEDKEETFDVVDENNRIIGKELRSVVHRKGLLHRTCHIIIFSHGGKVILQKRSADNLMCPLKWDLSAAEHLAQGEDYPSGAARGIREELSIRGVSLEKLRGPRLQEFSYPNGMIDRELTVLFRGSYGGEIRIDPNELAEARFFRIDDVKRMIKENPDQFTPWFLNEWKWLEDNDLV